MAEKGDAVLIICIGALNEVLKFRYRHQRGVYAKDNTPVRSILGCFIKAGFEAAERSSFFDPVHNDLFCAVCAAIA